MKPLLLLAPLLLAGCGDITRAEWEAGHPYDTKVVEIKLPNGDVRAAYHGVNPTIGFDGNNYACPSGIHVITFRNDILVQRWWQDDRATVGAK